MIKCTSLKGATKSKEVQMSDKKKNESKLDVDAESVKKISQELEGLSETENTWPEEFAASGGKPCPPINMTRRANEKPFEL